MILFAPAVCPSCKMQVFFYQSNKDKIIYGMADEIGEQIHEHICPFIEGEAYWSKGYL